MINWMITGLLVVAIIALAMVVWRARQTVAEMRASVKETVEEALAKAELGFKSASNEALYKQQAEASESLDRTISKSLAPVRDQLKEAKEEIKQFSKEARDSEVRSKENHDSVMSTIKELGKEADTLSKALRGDVKKMGDWGESTLERVLELSGLEKGLSYERQASVETEEGKKQRPDVLVKLPRDGDGVEKVLAIDSKVSLAGYTQYIEAGDDEDARKAGIDKLVEAVKKQAEETAKYKKIEGRETPGFALMFMPVEPAWQLLLSHQDGKFVDSLQRSQGVIILGPTNLMVSLRMVAHLWRGYMQDKNVKKITDLGEKMLDAAVRSAERFETLSKAIESTQKAAKGLNDSLTGSQGVRKYADDLKALGVKGKKEDDGG